MTSNFSNKGRVAVLDRPAEISQSEIHTDVLYSHLVKLKTKLRSVSEQIFLLEVLLCLIFFCKFRQKT